jgi:hypothetical protein
MEAMDVQVGQFTGYLTEFPFHYFSYLRSRPNRPQIQKQVMRKGRKERCKKGRRASNRQVAKRWLRGNKPEPAYTQASGVTNSQTSPRRAKSSFHPEINRSVAAIVWLRSWPSDACPPSCSRALVA